MKKSKERRSGTDRRTGDRRSRVELDAVGNERRAGVDRRSGIDRRQNRGIDPYARLQLSILVGAVLSFPAVRTWMDGAIPIDTLAIRVAIAMVFAVVAINGLNALIMSYQPKPSPQESTTDGIEDAVLLEGEDGGGALA
ncbi:MAG TPA: hypothetical protein VFU93_01785 [Acidimicrobiales bacterium]|nr:hypothetical protein [Acidimicrobiales bacterium]